MKARFPIGLNFTPFRQRSENKASHCITDIFTTTDIKGTVVKIRYQTKHSFCGQLVVNNDVIDTTIARALGNERIKKYL